MYANGNGILSKDTTSDDFYHLQSNYTQITKRNSAKNCMHYANDTVIDCNFMSDRAYPMQTIELTQCNRFVIYNLILRRMKYEKMRQLLNTFLVLSGITLPIEIDQLSSYNSDFKLNSK